MCLKGRSRKTRIETTTWWRPRDYPTVVWKVDPEKQGLKHCMEICNTYMQNQVWKVDPEKQGLKLFISPLIFLSIRVWKVDPEKQGLKLYINIYHYIVYVHFYSTPVWKVDPEKQGLKQMWIHKHKS